MTFMLVLDPLDLREGFHDEEGPVVRHTIRQPLRPDGRTARGVPVNS
jgi:hypothetical protein